MLIVDDDAALRGLLAERLNDDGAFVAAEAGSLRTAWAMVTAVGARFDAVILDVRLRDGDGCDFCIELRRRRFGMPVLMLTGADGVADVVRGLEAGASDYVVKPFRPGELIARLRAQLRSFAASETAILAIGPYTLVAGTRLLREPARNRRIYLTPKEAAVLKFLHHARGKPVARSVLLREIWGYNPSAASHTVETHVHRLRRKIECGLQGTQGLIVTEGTGYRLDLRPAAVRA